MSSAVNSVTVYPRTDGPGGEVRCEQMHVGHPEPGWVRVAPSYVGICGSDLDQLAGNVDPNFPVHYPYVLGHEWSGVVESVGEGVQLRPGDLVAGYAYRPGWRNHGAMADLFLANAQMCFAIPEGITARRAALLEPLACVLQGLRSIGGSDGGDQVVVLGCGALGLAMVGLAATTGARVAAVDRSQVRLDLAQRMGASTVLNSQHCGENLSAALLDLIGGRGADLVVECSGAPALQASSVAIAANSGRVLFLGLAHAAAAQVPLFQIQRRGLRLQASTAAEQSAWQAAIRLLDATDLDLTPIISDVFSFQDCAAAVAAAYDPAAHAKVMLQPAG
ncbi:MAG: zinc-binding dehydrogenase [Actinomycetales bacterium]|nr:zinc-binding dehydrogenase [Actinomycetales bacterium]